MLNLIYNPNASSGGDPLSCMHVAFEKEDGFISRKITADYCLNNITTLFTCPSNFGRN